MPDENKPGDDRHDKFRQRRREFEQACCENMDEFGFEWVEEFTQNGARYLIPGNGTQIQK